MRKNFFIRQYILAVFLLFLCGCAPAQEKAGQISTEETELFQNDEPIDTEKYEITATMTESGL